MKLRFIGFATLAAAGLLTIGWGVKTWRDDHSAKGWDSNPRSVARSGEDAGTTKRATRELTPSAPRSRLEQLLGNLAPKTGEPYGINGESGFHQIVASWQSSDFASAVDELLLRSRDASLSDQHQLLLNLLTAWSKLAPSAAAAALAKLSPQDQIEASRFVADAWFSMHPEAALAWARGLPEGEARSAALVAIGRQEALQHPQAAIELARDAGMTAECDDMIDQAARTWAALDAKAALDWVKRIEDPALKEKVLAGVAVAWADQDPYAAAGLIIESVDDGALEENSLVGIVQRIAFRDMDSARDWVAQFPEGRMRERAEQELTRIGERMTRVSNPH